MNRIIAWWAKNPVAANLLMLGILLAGSLAFLRMEREVWPTFGVNWVEISVTWPGAAPQEVEKQIVTRIEEAMDGLDGIERLRSTARQGSATVNIQADSGIDMDRFLNDVSRRVDSITALPDGMEPPRVREIVSRSEIMRVAVHGDVGEHTLKDTAERVRAELARRPGVSIVELFGTREEQVNIEISEQALRRYGLTFAEVAAAVRESSLNLSAGTVRTETGDVQLSARRRADSQADFERIVVRQTPDGGTLRLGDVAEVIDGFVDEELQATLNGEPAVLVQVMTTETMDVVKTSRSVRAYLAEEHAWLPEAVSLTLYEDSSQVYYNRMETISSAAFYGLLLVLGVLVLALRPKVAFWVSVGIATAYAGAFIFLPAAGVSLNFLSLFAFLLVIGVVVDDAIVVGESIHTQSLETGGGPDSAVLGAQLVAKPVIFAVVSTMLVFAPWLFLSGVDVKVTRDISIIVIAALSFSLIEALFILPAHLAKLRPRREMGRFARMQKAIAASISGFAQTRYRRWVTAALNRRGLTVSCFLAAFIVSLGLVSSGWLKMTFMPEVESEQIAVDVELPPGTPYDRALAVLEQLQRAEKRLEEEANAASESGGRLVENWYTRARPSSVLALVRLAPPGQREMSAEQAADRLRALIGEIPDAQSVEVDYTLNSPQPPVEFRVNHPDLDRLRRAVADLKSQLQTFDAVYDVRDNLQAAREEIQVSVKPGAQSVGVTLGEVARQLRRAYYGEEVQRLPRDGEDVKVMVRYPEEARRTLESLSNFRVRTGDGAAVPLESVAKIDYEPSIREINRRNGQRSAVVSAELTDPGLRKRIYSDLNESFFPQWEQRYPGVSRGAIGRAEAQAEFMAEVLSLEAIALFAMYALIAVAFRSYLLPLLVMTAIPFGFLGAVLGHLSFGMALTLYSYLGLAAAAGVVVNDNLVLVDRINRLREQGWDPVQALIEGGVSRFRPVILTSLTTFVGLLPMMLEQSTQAQFLKPTVIALAFGVVVATPVTLFLVPALYKLGEDTKAQSKRALGRLRLNRRASRPSLQQPAE